MEQEDELTRAVKLSDELNEMKIGECDSCGDSLYSWQTRYYATIKGKGYMLCPCCCIRFEATPIAKTNFGELKRYGAEEMADFLTWVQQDAYSYGSIDTYGSLVYPSTYDNWLNWFWEKTDEQEG